jgi:2,4-dienoyl-CoA reductase-like NADH-dependent reductase (Old Yellow Enzyme family)
MSKLQDALIVRGNTIKNRIVMEPMYTFSFRGDDGHFYGRQHLEHYEARARGGAGLIILQATHCVGASDGSGQWTEYDKGILRTIAHRCHDNDTVVLMQLSCGDTDINALSADEIRAMQREMTSAAIAACALGFNGAEFHFAHGFTLCKFIDAAYNKRQDAFGGSAENRARVLTDILPEIRAKTGATFIIGVRMGEFLPESRDGFEIARQFEKSGIDLLNISFGMKIPDDPVPAGFICSPMAFSGCRVKQAVDSVPVIAAGGLRTEEQVRFLIEHDYVDFAGIGTAFLADPSFAAAVLNSQPPTKCLNCARCLWFTDHTKCPARV